MRRLRLTLLAAMAAAPSALLANPAGESLVSGTATVSRPDATTVQINQGTPRAIINWDTFSSDTGELIRFVQPSSSAAILNRVTGGSLSQLYGRMQANGRVLLVNPNGITFGAGGQVDVGGLIASTLDITNANFNADHWQFDGVPNGSVPGHIANDSTLNAGNGGFIVLLGQGGAQNDTAINAPHGSIVLASGSSIFVDPVGDGLVMYQVTAPTLTQYDANGDGNNDAGNDGIANYGTLTANGGRIALETYNDFITYAAIYNSGGLIRAQTASVGENGQIILTARGSGILQAGNLDASGPGNGSVTLTTDRAAALRPPQDYGAPGDGNNPPSVMAHSFQMQAADFSPQRVTVAADLIDLRSTGDFNFGGITVKGQNSANPASVRLQGNQLELQGVTLTSPALTLVATGTPSDADPNGGRITVIDDTLSGQTLQVQGANLDLRTPLDYATSIDLSGSVRISLTDAVLGGNTPGAVSFSTPREVLIGNTTINATTLTAQVGSAHVQYANGFNLHDSTVNAASMQIIADDMGVDGTSALTTTGLMDLHANLDIRATPVHAGSLHVTGSAFLGDDDVRAASMRFDTPELQVRGSKLTGATLTVQGINNAGQFNLTPSATTGNAARADFTQSITVDTGVVDIEGTPLLHAPLISLTSHGGGANDLFISGSALSGASLQTQAVSLLLASGTGGTKTTLDFGTTALAASARITLDGAAIGSTTPGAVSFTTPRQAIIQASTIHATTLTTQVGADHVQYDNAVNIHDSTLTADSMQLGADGVAVDGASALTTSSLMDIRADLDARGVPLHAGSLHLAGRGFLEDDDVQTTAGMQFDSGNLQVRGTTLTGTTLAVNGSGTPSEFDLTPSARTGRAAAASFSQSIALNTGVIVIGDTAVHAPQVTMAANGGSATGLSDLFLSGAKLDGNKLQAHATGIDIRGGNINAKSTLDFGTSLDMTSVGRTAIQNTVIGGQAVSPVNITAGENIELQATTIHAGDLILRAAYGTTDAYNGIFLTDTHLTGNVVWLNARGGVSDDFTNGPAQTMSSIDAQGLGVNGNTGVLLGRTVIHVGTGLAPFGTDSGMLGELAAFSPDRAPLSPGANASFSSPRLVIGALTLDGDYLLLQSDNLDLLSPVTAPPNLLVNLRPGSPRASLGVEQNDEYRHNVNYSYSSYFARFPGTTLVFGGTDYNGFIFAGEAGPINFLAPHDNTGVFFMTNGLVLQRSAINTNGPVGVLAGIDSAPADTAQQEDELKGKSSDDDDEGSDHDVQRVTASATEQECR